VADFFIAAAFPVAWPFGVLNVMGGPVGSFLLAPVRFSTLVSLPEPIVFSGYDN